MKPPRRILIGAASFADARAALKLAAQLAVRSRAVIGGLLVEEVLLSELPRLGGQRLITASGTLRDVPTGAELSRSIERDARAFQAALSDLALAEGPLERRRGELTVAIWEDAQGWDVLVCGQRETHGLRGRIVLIAPPRGTKSDARDLAHDLARAAGTTTLALGIAPDADQADEVFATEAALLARIGRLNCAAVVLDRAAGPIRTLDQLRALVETARCPVMLVGKPTQSAAPTDDRGHGAAGSRLG